MAAIFYQDYLWVKSGITGTNNYESHRNYREI
jgi:hypothetical protein